MELTKESYQRTKFQTEGMACPEAKDVKKPTISQTCVHSFCYRQFQYTYTLSWRQRGDCSFLQEAIWKSNLGMIPWFLKKPEQEDLHILRPRFYQTLAFQKQCKSLLLSRSHITVLKAKIDQNFSCSTENESFNQMKRSQCLHEPFGLCLCPKHKKSWVHH